MNNETTLPEETSVDQETGTFSDQETGTLPDQETESLSDQEAGTVIVTGEDYTEVLTEINTTLHHVDSTLEYGVCVLIVFVVVMLLQYVYKFFKMFF